MSCDQPATWLSALVCRTSTVQVLLLPASGIAYHPLRTFRPCLSQTAQLCPPRRPASFKGRLSDTMAVEHGRKLGQIPLVPNCTSVSSDSVGSALSAPRRGRDAGRTKFRPGTTPQSHSIPSPSRSASIRGIPAPLKPPRRLVAVVERREPREQCSFSFPPMTDSL